MNYFQTIENYIKLNQKESYHNFYLLANWDQIKIKDQILLADIIEEKSIISDLLEKNKLFNLLVAHLIDEIMLKKTINKNKIQKLLKNNYFYLAEKILKASNENNQDKTKSRLIDFFKNNQLKTIFQTIVFGTLLFSNNDILMRTILLVTNFTLAVWWGMEISKVTNHNNYQQKFSCFDPGIVEIYEKLKRARSQNKQKLSVWKNELFNGMVQSKVLKTMLISTYNDHYRNELNISKKKLKNPLLEEWEKTLGYFLEVGKNQEKFHKEIISQGVAKKEQIIIEEALNNPIDDFKNNQITKTSQKSNKFKL